MPMRLPAERIERVDLVQDELDRDVVGADLTEDGRDGTDRLREALFRERGVGHVEDEVGDERLLERCSEALDQLGRQASDEPDRVGHEVALPVVPNARVGVERLEEPIVDGCVGAGESVQKRRLADVRVAGERDRRAGRAQALLAPRSAAPAGPGGAA